MNVSQHHDADTSLEQEIRNNTVVAALLLVGLATLVGAFEEATSWLRSTPGVLIRVYALPLIAPIITIALWIYTSGLERRAGINVVRGQLVLLIVVSFVAALLGGSMGQTFSLYYGVLLLLLATKITDQRLVIGGVIATVSWLGLALGVVSTGYALFLLITAVLIVGCIFAPRKPRSARLTRS